MRSGYRILRLCALLLAALLVAGCAGSRASRFYQLQPLAVGGSRQPPAAAGQSSVVGVGPVSIPEYLDRPQIVTRTVGNELHMAEHHRWAESLEDNFARVLTENLSTLLPDDYVVTLPWPGTSRMTYQVVVKVVQFDSSAAGQVWLRADWSVLGGRGIKVLAMRKSNIQLTADADDYEALVAAQSRAVAELSRHIASVVKSLPRRATAP